MSHLFGKALTAYRQYAKLSQRELAERAGLHYPTISRWESGQRHPEHQHVAAVCAALSLAPRDTAILHLFAGFVPKEITTSGEAVKRVADTIVAWEGERG